MTIAKMTFRTHFTVATGLSNQPCQITKWGRFMKSKWSRHKIKIFRGSRDFFGPINGTSDSEGHFWAQNIEGSSKSRDFCARDHFESLKRPHFVIWQGCFDKPEPNLQHKYISNFIPPVLLFFEAFFWFLVF